MKLGSSTDEPYTNGTPSAKRKARPSAELDGLDQKEKPEAKRTRRSATPDPKRTKRSTTPGVPGKREPTAYVVRHGMNPLPAPIPPVTKAVLDAGLAPHVTAPLAKAPDAAQALQKQGPVLAREAFVFGNGDMGQHGLGTDVLDEIKRPRRHAWIAKEIAEGRLGEGGLELVAAGGMHTLAIDSTGRVCIVDVPIPPYPAHPPLSFADLLVGHQRQRMSGTPHDARSKRVGRSV